MSEAAVKAVSSASSWPWCVVMTDNRPFDAAPTWVRENVACAAAYAQRHGYGFAMHQWQLDASALAKPPPVVGAFGCVHPRRGPLSPHWCKIAAVAHSLLHGIDGRRCEQLLYLDTDVELVDPTISVRDYLRLLHVRGDEGLIDDAWELLFTSNAPHVPSGLCTGIFWVRNSIMACGILRNWWDANWPDQARFSFDQAAMADGVHAYNRAYGAAVRVAPSSVTWWREE